MKCKKGGKKVLQTPWMCSSWLSEQVHLYSCVKAREWNRNSKIFSNGLRHFDSVLFFSLPGEWINEWFLPSGENPFTRENILNSYRCRRKTRVDLRCGGWDRLYVLGAGWHVSAWGLVYIFVFIHSSHVSEMSTGGMNGPLPSRGYSFKGGKPREQQCIMRMKWAFTNLVGNRSQRQDRECCELCLWGMDCPWSVKWRKGEVQAVVYACCPFVDGAAFSLCAIMTWDLPFNLLCKVLQREEEYLFISVS